MFSIGYLNRYIENLMTKHMVVAKRILMYVNCTLELGLVYVTGEAQMKLVVYSNSDDDIDPYDRKSTRGMASFL